MNCIRITWRWMEDSDRQRPHPDPHLWFALAIKSPLVKGQHQQPPHVFNKKKDNIRGFT